MLVLSFMDIQSSHNHSLSSQNTPSLPYYQFLIDIIKVHAIFILTGKDVLWHIINTYTHTPTSIDKWYYHYTNFHSAGKNVQSRIFQFFFKTARDTEVKTFKYNICVHCYTFMHFRYLQLDKFTLIKHHIFM